MRRISVLGLALLLGVTFSVSSIAAEAQYNVGIIVVKQKSVADALRARIQKGENFEELALANSIGPNARRGGRLGMVADSKLRSEYRQALAGMMPGQVSRVIPVEEGYTLLMLFRPESTPDPSSSQSVGTPGIAPPTSTTPSTTSSFVPSTPPASGSASGTASVSGERTRFMVEPTTAEAINIGLLTEVLNGLEFMQKSDLKRAETAFQKATTIDPQDDSSQLLLNMVQESLAGKYHPKVMVAMADAFTSLLQGEAFTAYERFLSISQQNPSLWQAKLMVATMLMESRQWDDALVAMQEVVKIKPDYARSYLVIGNLYYYQMKGQDAEAAYVQAINLDPALADGHYFLGRLYMGYGEVEFAEQEYKRALDLNPMLYDAFNDLGTIYLYANRYKEAEEFFNNALAVNPGFVPAMINLGIMYANQKQWDKARAQLEKAVEAPVIMPAANFNLGLVYMQLGMWSQAEEQVNLAAGAGYQVPEAVFNMLKEKRIN